MVRFNGLILKKKQQQKTKNKTKQKPKPHNGMAAEKKLPIT